MLLTPEHGMTRTDYLQSFSFQGKSQHFLLEGCGLSRKEKSSTQIQKPKRLVFSTRWLHQLHKNWLSQTRWLQKSISLGLGLDSTLKGSNTEHEKQQSGYRQQQELGRLRQTVIKTPWGPDLSGSGPHTHTHRRRWGAGALCTHIPGISQDGILFHELTTMTNCKVWSECEERRPVARLIQQWSPVFSGCLQLKSHVETGCRGTELHNNLCTTVPLTQSANNHSFW